MKARLLTIALCLLLITAVVPVVPVFAATTYYVDAAGGGDFTTISAAVAAATAGDTIIVKDGSYTENVAVDKSLTIQSENGAASTIVNVPNPYAPAFDVNADGVTIDGFTVVGPTESHIAGIELVDANDCVIQNNDCSLCYNGIHLGGTATNNVIGSNYCHDNTKRGISVRDTAHDNFMVGNTVESNSEDGFCIKDTSYDNTLWLNNVLQSVEILTSVVLNSPAELTYTYNGNSYTGYLGNYWHDYGWSDTDGDGVGDLPHSAGSYTDNYPLVAQSGNYTLEEEEPPTGSSSLSATTNIVIPMVGIELDRTSIDYGDVGPGASSSVETVVVTNTGTYDVDVTLEVQGADATAQDFYEQSLYVNSSLYDIAAVIASLLVGGSQPVDTRLQVPATWSIPGAQEATYIFWAEATS